VTVEVSQITAGSVTTLTDSATIAWPANQGYSYQVTLGGSRTMVNPSDMTIGATYTITVIQDSTGSRSLTWGSAYKFPAATFVAENPTSDAAVPPTLSTRAGSRTILTFWSDGANMYLTSTIKDLQGKVNAPSNLVASQNKADRVTLTWTDNSTDETSFEIWRADEFSVYQLYATVGAGVATYDDMAAEPDPGRVYFVRARRNSECSVFSDFATGFHT
jgi:hypothetical protein